MSYSFENIPHFQHYPCMRPFVGKKYLSPKHKKILLLGESFYLPNTTNIHHSVSGWYGGYYSAMKDWELEWIDTNGLLNCSWESAGHMIYRELNRCVEKIMCDHEYRGIDEVAFANYFQRPAEEEGASFRNFMRHEDRLVSSQVIAEVVEVIKPESIIFVSKFAADVGIKELKSKYDHVAIEYVCHPGTGGLYWNNKEYKHGKSRFLELLKLSMTS